MTFGADSSKTAVVGLVTVPMYSTLTCPQVQTKCLCSHPEVFAISRWHDYMVLLDCKAPPGKRWCPLLFLVHKS